MSTADPIYLMFERLRKREGGYVFDADDPGGETKYGISKRSYPTLDIKNLTVAQAHVIYDRDFWRRPRINQLPFFPLQEQMLDFAVHSGAPQAVKTLQRVLGVAADGLIGPETLSAAQTFRDQRVLNNLLASARTAFLRSLVHRRPRNAKYESGWIARAQAFLLTD